MYNPFKYSNTNKRYHTWDYYLKDKYGFKVGRASLNAKFSCPNIDGTKGKGGCTFCFAGSSDSFAPIEDQYQEQLEVLNNKWNTNKHFVYFQAFTNTHGSLEKVIETIKPFKNRKDSVGIIIGTRADCLQDDKIEFLAELSQENDIWVELGLQSSNDTTADKINRCHTFKEFQDAVKKLRKHNINIAVHLINSLPGETKTEMLQTVKDVVACDVQAIKIHMLNIVKNTQMEKEADNIPLLSKEEYIDIVCDQLELIPAHIVISRLTGDPDKDILIKPHWTVDKIALLNDIDKELEKRDTWQGKKVDKQLSPTVHYTRMLMDRYSNKDYVVVDATLGNGFDSEFLARLNKKVFGFDINETAIKRSMQRLTSFSNVEIINDSHANIANYIDAIDLLVFNTGYLPGSDKKLTTKGETTVKAVLEGYRLLNKGGFIILTLYKGHDDNQEYNEVIKALNDHKVYFKETIVEQLNHAPSIITIKK